MKNLKIASALLAVLIVVASAFTSKYSGANYGFISKQLVGPSQWKYTVVDLDAIQHDYSCDQDGPGCLIEFEQAPDEDFVTRSGNRDEIMEFILDVNVDPEEGELFNYVP